MRRRVHTRSPPIAPGLSAMADAGGEVAAVPASGPADGLGNGAGATPAQPNHPLSRKLHKILETRLDNDKVTGGGGGAGRGLRPSRPGLRETLAVHRRSCAPAVLFTRTPTRTAYPTLLEEDWTALLRAGCPSAALISQAYTWHTRPCKARPVRHTRHVKR